MKKLTYLFAMLIMIAAIISCSKESTNDNELDLLKKATAVTQPTASLPISAGGTTPYHIPGANPGGNRTCAEVAKAWKLDPNPFLCGEKIDYSYGAFAGEFPSGLSVTTDGKYVSFEMEDCILIGDKYYKVGAVIVKGSNNANVYYYPDGTTEDSGLASPFNNSGNPSGLSNLTFGFIECEKELVIAVKAFYWNGTKNTYCESSGKQVFMTTAWCGSLGINPYPSSSYFEMKSPYIKIGKVEVENGDVTITLDVDKNFVLIATYLYIGTEEDLTTNNLLYDLCPWYQNNDVWILNNVPHTNEDGYSFMTFDF